MCVSSLDFLVVMFYAMFSYVSFLLLLYVDVRVMRSHACYALLGSICLFAFHHVSCLDLYPYMSIMLGFMFHHVYVLSFHMFTHAMPYLCPDLCFHMPICLDLCLCAKLPLELPQSPS